MQKKPPQFHGSGGRIVDLDCFTQRHENWCGMTKAEVDAFMEEGRVEREREHLLYHWVPSSPAN